MTTICPVCQDVVCTCEWSLNELYESWGLNTGSFLAAQQPGPISDCDDDTDICHGLSVFDSIYASIKNSVSNSRLSSYKGPVIGEDAYSVGDLVNYQPLWGIVDWNKPWIVKKVFSIDPLDCAFFDYEITDGCETHLVTHYEINKMGKDDKIQK
jgi:hypothetical protein